MANQEQLEILKQGADIWNEWRRENASAVIDLYQADLQDADLTHADLADANLAKAYLRGAYFIATSLSGANLSNAHLMNAEFDDVEMNNADLTGADLSKSTIWDGYISNTNLKKAVLRGTNISQTNLSGTNLIEADLTETEFSRTNLDEVDFTNADLSGTIFRDVILNKANFSKTILGLTIFSNSDISTVFGLEDVIHKSPSTVGTDTLQRSMGKIPVAFLRGCGLSDWEIESAKLYHPNLTNEEISRIQYNIYDLRATQAIQVSPLFISYSHNDGVFVDKLESYLNKKGVRFWRDIHDMKSGRMEKQIDRAMRLNPTVLLILSDHSQQSDWVEHEVRTARALEKETGRDVLCPVALNDSWKKSPWSKRIMEQVTEYNILDFSAWKDDAKFKSTFNKLIDGLELFYK